MQTLFTQSMPEMSGCKAWKEMCAALPSLSLCPSSANPGGSAAVPDLLTWTFLFCVSSLIWSPHLQAHMVDMYYQSLFLTQLFRW
jgi:hypothetical protein